MKVVIMEPVCPVMTHPRPDCALADEALYGMEAEVVEAQGEYRRLRTFYGYEGWVPAELLMEDGRLVAAWQAKAKKLVRHKNFADVMAEPGVRSWPLITLPLGAAVAPVADAGEGWSRVELVSGQQGYLRTSWLAGPPGDPAELGEEALRAGLVETAMRYVGTPYRWGGKTPMGIDCSGLVSMAYLLNGIIIYRDARIEPGFDLVEIPRDEMKPGDAIFFPGHVAMYLGGGRYVHATGRAGDDGVALNSLDPAAAGYRADLAGSIEAVGSYVGFHR